MQYSLQAIPTCVDESRPGTNIKPPDLGNEVGFRAKKESRVGSRLVDTAPRVKPAAARWCAGLAQHLGTEQGTVRRVTNQQDLAVESVRSGLRRAEVDYGITYGERLAEMVAVHSVGTVGNCLLTG